MRPAIIILGLALVLTGCGTLVEGQTQRVTLSTPGASESRCWLDNGVRYAVEGGQSLEIMRSNNDLIVDCYASGNRHKVVRVPSAYNDWSTANILNGAVPGYGYDHVSGGLYCYPEIITVDFAAMPARDYDLPGYHDADAPNPYVQPIETYGATTPKLESDGSYLRRNIVKRDGNLNSNPFSTIAPTGLTGKPPAVSRTTGPAPYNP